MPFAKRQVIDLPTAKHWQSRRGAGPMSDQYLGPDEHNPHKRRGLALFDKGLQNLQPMDRPATPQTEMCSSPKPTQFMDSSNFLMLTQAN